MAVSMQPCSHARQNRRRTQTGTEALAYTHLPHTRWLCRKWYPVSGEAGYGSDYSWAITSKAIACAFTIGCSTGKKGPDNYFFMIMPSWWMWMIIAIQGEREFFFLCVWNGNQRLSSSSHFSLKTLHLWHTYKKPTRSSSYGRGEGAGGGCALQC